MELNVLLRGQSNAAILDRSQGWSNLATQIQQFLGFDGTTNKINLLENDSDPSGANTVVGGTAFVGDWLQPNGAGWQAGWSNTSIENGLLTYINNMPADEKAAPTAVVWLHNEYDSTNPNLTTAEWESAVRDDAQQVRAAFGQSAATVPYVFVNAIPYGSGAIDSVNQAIKLGMADLAADPSFHAVVGVQADDVEMDGTAFNGGVAGVYGGPHMDEHDGELVGQRLARAIAQTFAAYAQPGSPVASGQFDAFGPEAVAAQPDGANQVLVTASLDNAALATSLSSDAANGVGWSILDGGQTLNATAAQVMGGNQVLLTFGQPVPTDASARLYYAYGYGRIATGSTDPGDGTAIYDTQQMPLWTPAAGLPLAASGGSDTVPAGSGSASGSNNAPNTFLSGSSGTATPVARGELLYAGKHSTTLTGSGGEDLFVIDASGTAAVSDIITDFGAGDELVVWGAPGVSLQGSWSDSGQGGALLAISAGGGTLATVLFSGVSEATAQGYALSSGSAGGLSDLIVRAG
jgi:hypothetical protein